MVEEWVSDDEDGGTPGDSVLGLTPVVTPQPTPIPKPVVPKKKLVPVVGPNQFDVDDPVAALEAALGF